MIKRVLFATRRGDVAEEQFPAAWRQAWSASVEAPGSARPVRVAVCTAMPDVTPDPKHDGIGLEWFTDNEHVARYEAWRSSAGAAPRLEQVVDASKSPVVVADEHVLRGAEWLEERWREGGRRLKHMAIARRAKGLTLSEFFDRWQSRAGKVGVAVIPDEARGLAYVQNRPQLRDEEWAYDALNEVYFDELGGLQARIGYFERTLGDQTEGDLVRESWFVAAREELLFDQARQ